MGFEADLLAVRRLIAGAASRGVEPVRDDGRGEGDASEQLHSMLFSATWDARAEQLATALMRPAAVHITVGALTLAVARTVEQVRTLAKTRRALHRRGPTRAASSVRTPAHRLKVPAWRLEGSSAKHAALHALCLAAHLPSRSLPTGRMPSATLPALSALR